jgi:autophagy-related protein 2
MANSVVNLADIRMRPRMGLETALQSSETPESPRIDHIPFRLTVALRDCVIGLNPREIAAKGLFIFTYARFSVAIPKTGQSQAVLDVKRASVMIIDDVQNVDAVDNSHHRRDLATGHGEQVQAFSVKGFVPVCFISSALVSVKVVQLDHDGEKSLDVEVRDDLLILETCADSTQTLISLLNGLTPPSPPSNDIRYRTEIMPIQDMLASFSGDAFATDQFIDAEGTLPAISGAHSGQEAHEDDSGEELEYVSDFFPPRPGGSQDPLGSSVTGSQQNLLNSFHSDYHVSSSLGDLEFKDDHFAQRSSVGGTAHRWDSTQNTYSLANDGKLYGSPVRIRVRDVHFIWNLFDGYDWRRTRDTISKAVRNIEMKATERRAKANSRLAFEEDDEESVIGDFLFNSIYIGIPASKDPRDLANEINHNIDDLVSETGSYTTSTTATATTTRPGSSTGRGKKLRLSRSKHHKMTFELKGICADIVVFPPEMGETQSSIDVRVNNLEIFDHIPTSTWKKFATYMHDAGERESGTSMVHIEILNVKPIADLAASELVLKVRNSSSRTPTDGL